MDLRDYVWFHNLRGLTAVGPYTPIRPERYTEPHLGWAKVFTGHTEHLETVNELLTAQCMPIVQVFREGMVGKAAPDGWYADIFSPYIEAGALWCELYDPPNTPSAGVTRDTLPTLVDNWLAWAERIVGLGGYPAFPVLAASAGAEWATLVWARTMFEYLHTHHEQRFLYIVAHGLWFSVETCIENRFYQQPPGGPRHTARRYYQVKADEPGWHFEHPYDPIQQVMDRGRTIMGGTEDTPHGAPFGIIATAQMMQDLLKVTFEVGPVPVVATRGGMWPVLQPGDEASQPHPAYPPADHNSQVEATVAMLEWLVQRGPPWFWGMTLRSEHTYYDGDAAHAVMTRWAQAAPTKKVVPAMDTGGLAHPPAEDTAVVLARVDDASLEGEIRDEDTLMGLLAVDEPVVLEPGEEPQPGVNILAALEPVHVPHAPGFVDAREFAAALDELGAAAVLDRLPGGEHRPPAGQALPEAERAFFAMLDDHTEVDNDDGLTALQRFDWMISSDGTDVITTPTNEHDAPDFLDIVEEFTGERPYATQASSAERAYHALQNRLRHAHLLYIEPHSIQLTAIQLYWEAFRPTLVTNFALLGHLPAEAAPIVTAVAPSERHDALRAQVARAAPHATLDLIELGKLEATLNERLHQRSPYELP